MPLPDDTINSDEHTEALADLGVGVDAEETVNIRDVSRENIEGHGSAESPPGVEDIETEGAASNMEAAVTTIDTGPPYSIFRYIYLYLQVSRYATIDGEA